MATASIPRQVDNLELAAYTIDQTCVVLGLSRPSVYKLIETGQLRSIVLGLKSNNRAGRRLIPATEINRLLADDGATGS